MASIATFHTTKIIIPDNSKFSFIGSIPESMYWCVSSESKIMKSYKAQQVSGPRFITPEMQKTLDEADAQKKRGWKGEKVKQGKEGSSSQALIIKKWKGTGDDPSAPKKRKLKKMATPPLSPSNIDYVPSNEEPVQKNDIMTLSLIQWYMVIRNHHLHTKR